MPPRLHTRLLLPVLVAAAVAALPGSAAASHRSSGFDTAATVSGCGGDAMSIAAEIQPAEGRRARKARRRALRAIRGANLRIRFEAAPLTGQPTVGGEVDLGGEAAARRYARFSDLRAENYVGIVRYRWVRDGRTVRSGVIRTTTTTAGGRRGRAYCSLEVGKPPRDTQPPFILPIPHDAAWARGPLDVHFYVVDDLSGVAGVGWRLDGGPVGTGRTVRIESEGEHQLLYYARDAAGNQTQPATATLRVDTRPPTAPTVTSPSGPTTDTTPDVHWAPSTDSGSGVQGYWVVVRNANGGVIYSHSVKAGDPTVATVAPALATGQYTAEVVALDGAGPQPFASRATTSFSVIDAATGGSTDNDADGHVDAADNCPFTANPDQGNLDGDGAGDACDGDDDADEVDDARDNCPTVANRGQENTGGGPAGDACEDRDADFWPDASDNCPANRNIDQADADKDGRGDVCDDDLDGDGDLNAADNCPALANPDQADNDGSGGGDACDEDDDNDGDVDTSDNCVTTPNPQQENTGGTPAGDHCEDRDADTRLDAADNCVDAPNPQQENTGGTAAGDHCEDRDTPADGHLDAVDNCKDTANGSQRDTDGDKMGNACDDDADGDGDPNLSDSNDDNDTFPDAGDDCDVDPGPAAAPGTNGCPSPMP